MKSSGNTLKCAILITLLSIILTILFFRIKFIDNEIINLLLDISIGLIGSSVISLFLCIPPYNNSKEKTILDFYDTFYKKIVEVSKLDYYYIDVEKQIFINYIRETNNNIMHKKTGLKIKNKYKYRNIIINELERINDDSLINMSDKEKHNLIKRNLDDWTNNELEKIDKVLKQYQELANITIYDLNSILGDIKYAFNNKKLKFIEKKLYKPLYDFLSEIRNLKFHIDLYFSGSGNQSVVIEKLFNMQEKIFRVDEKNDKKNIIKIFYFEWLDNMEKKLEEFRIMIFKDKTRTFEPIPFFYTVCNIKK